MNEYVDRHGRTRIYLRRLGRKQIPLPTPMFSHEFWTAYRAAIDASEMPKTIRRIKAGTIDAAVSGYYGSAEFKALADTTKSVYRNILNRFADEHGDGPVAGMQTRHVNAMIDKVADSPSAASNFRKRLKAVMDYAVSAGMREDNPVVAAKRVKLKSLGHRTWTEDDIAAFRAHWPEDTMQRQSMEILLYTGVRRSDAVRLGWQHVKGGALVITTKKSQGHVELHVPIHVELVRFLDMCPKDKPTFILTGYGNSKSEKAFSSWVSEAAKEAGLPAKSAPHGLRKAACRRLAETGCSALEIMSITGHTDIREIERYCREAARKSLSLAAMAKLEGGFDVRLPNPAERLGKADDKSLKLLYKKKNWRSQQDSNLQPTE